MNGSSVRLVELVTYRADPTDLKREKRVLATQERGPIVPGTSDYWEQVALVVPPVPPSGLGGPCQIIDVQYALEFNVDPSGIGMDLEVSLGLTIGRQSQAAVPHVHFSKSGQISRSNWGKLPCNLGKRCFTA
jgi:hypothetical protein